MSILEQDFSDKTTWHKHSEYSD